MTDETERMLADLARAKVVFQHRAIVAVLFEKRDGVPKSSGASSPAQCEPS
jgi:hypothetical protein